MNQLTPQLNPSDGEHAQSAQGDVIVDVRQVSKKFCRNLKRSLWYGAQDMLAELTLGRRDSHRLRPGEFWAVNDVSFQLRQGEALGLVGRNGAGKTTLLRTIAGLIRPDTGEIRTRGRIAPLLALGAGFNPVLTGRENVYINMAVLGLSTREINRSFDSVVDFAEIEAALDAPVRTYSSGMTARLGFACAVHVRPDVFIIDEALAVGDVNFRGKCYRKLAELRRKGISLLVVSHSAHILMAVCDRAAYLSQGKLLMTGSTPDVVSRYTRDCEEPGIPSPAEAPRGMFSKPPRSSEMTSGLDILEVELQGAEGSSPGTLESGRPAQLRVSCRCYRAVKDANLFVGVKKHQGGNEFLLALNSRLDRRPVNLQPGDHDLVVRFPACCLPRGTFSLKVYIEEPQLYMLDIVDWDRIQFQVHADSHMYSCAFYQPREWLVPTGESASLRLAS